LCSAGLPPLSIASISTIASAPVPAPAPASDAPRAPRNPRCRSSMSCSRPVAVGELRPRGAARGVPMPGGGDGEGDGEASGVSAG
jgi:hypothetical protein